MARRPPPTGSSVLPQQTRQNEYFVPRDGIDREVITADICRYLGNDALVRPGNYENPQNGQVIQGYFINAYRNLTSAMIQDLKADSARWDQERRQQSANRNSAGGGTMALNGVFITSSNSPLGQYRDSGIHQSRQHLGPTENYAGTAGNDPFDNGPRYPGSGTPGYTGAAGTYAQQYAAQQGGYQPGYAAGATQFSPSQSNVSYGAGHAVAAPSYGQTTQGAGYNFVDANLRADTQGQSDPYNNDHYGTQRDLRGDPRGPVTSSMASARTTYTTAGPSSSQVFPSGQTTGYYTQSGTPAAASYSSSVPPGDPFYGRASPAGTAPYSASQDPQYESTPAHKRTGSAQNTQLPTSGSARRREDRDSVERHTDQRHGHRSHRTAR
ncbi:hypothetical protein F4777DRAFT_586377 [Nemania sp. FL0916]|nr:hypothetical protein F4777DRAFT_586377 [Nemania sp. FL0916]